MILRVLLLFSTFLLSLNFNLQAGLWSQITELFGGQGKPTLPPIRVLIAHDLEGIDLEIKGCYSLYDPYADSYISSRFIGKNKYLQPLSDGLKWGETFPGLYQLKIRPDEPQALMVINQCEYTGNLYIYDIGGTISIVNEIPIEDYIRSILSQYDHLSLHAEILAAIAIVARTTAYFQAINPKNTYWAVDAQKVDYKGRVRKTNPDFESTIGATRHMIMSRTGVYEGIATPFMAEFGPLSVRQLAKDVEIAKISLEEAEEMAQQGEHAAQILAKAFPGTTIMLMQPATP